MSPRFDAIQDAAATLKALCAASGYKITAIQVASDLDLNLIQAEIVKNRLVPSEGRIPVEIGGVPIVVAPETRTPDAG